MPRKGPFENVLGYRPTIPKTRGKASLVAAESMGIVLCQFAMRKTELSGVVMIKATIH